MYVNMYNVYIGNYIILQIKSSYAVRLFQVLLSKSLLVLYEKQVLRGAIKDTVCRRDKVILAA